MLLEDAQFLYGLWCVQKGKRMEIPADFKNAATENMIFTGVSSIFGGKEIIYTYIQQARCASLQFLIEAPESINYYKEENRLSKKDNIYRTLQEAFAAGNGEIILHLTQGLVDFTAKNHFTILDLIGVGNYICINLTGQDEDAFQKMGMESIQVSWKSIRMQKVIFLIWKTKSRRPFRRLSGDVFVRRISSGM